MWQLERRKNRECTRRIQFPQSQELVVAYTCADDNSEVAQVFECLLFTAVLKLSRLKVQECKNTAEEV